MLDWRALLAGPLAFLVAVVAALASAPPWLFVAGFPCGFLAGYLADGGGLRSLLHGVLASAALVALCWAAIAAFVVSYQPVYVAPGYGMNLAVLALVAVGLGVEGAVGAVLAGAVARLG